MTQILIVQLVMLAGLVAVEDPREILDRAISDFQKARIGESAAGFDRLVKLAPEQAPSLWQRGIVLYYAGRYQDCRAQFELHRTVNPNDVENAAWHYLCVARAESPVKAKAALLPVGPDSRVPMREIYEMFQGALKPAQVIATSRQGPEAEFYSHLYAGLYYEAQGDKKRALDLIRVAAEDRFRGGGFMHDVARVHLRMGR